MRAFLKSFFLTSVSIFHTGTGFAQADSFEVTSNKLTLVRGGAYLTSYLQSKGNSSSTLFVWAPQLKVNDTFSLIADVGSTVLNTPSNRFLVLYGMMRPDFAFTKEWHGDVGAGMQQWTKEDGLIAMYGIGMSYEFENMFWGLIRRARVGANSIPKAKHPTYQMVAGIETDFFNVQERVLSNEKQEPPQLKPQEPTPTATPSPEPAVEPSPTPAPAPVVSAAPVKVNLSSTLVTFKKGSAVLEKSSKELIERIGKFLAQNKTWEKLEVSGHTDRSGSEKLNAKLSAARAESVRTVLISSGVSSEKLNARGFGSTHILASEDPKSAKNRRVELAFAGVSDAKAIEEGIKNAIDQK